MVKGLRLESAARSTFTCAAGFFRMSPSRHADLKNSDHFSLLLAVLAEVRAAT